MRVCIYIHIYIYTYIYIYIIYIYMCVYTCDFGDDVSMANVCILIQELCFKF